MRRALFAAVVLVGCSRSPEPAPAPPSSASTSSLPADAAAASTSVVDAAPPLHVVAVSVASFGKGSVLDQCVDYRVSSLLAPDAGADPAGQLAASVLAMLKTKTNETMRVFKPCAEQFADKGALAHCTLHTTQPVLPRDADAAAAATTTEHPDAGTFDVDVVLHYYDLKTIERDDSYLKQCLALKGDWQGLDKQSAAYQEAVGARARRNAAGP
jgi:hypothetical protein